MIPVVLPLEFASQLGESTVNDQRVLREARALGPLGAELEAEDVFATTSGATTPVPTDPRRPSSATDVENAPGVVVAHAADAPVPSTHRECAGRATRLMFGREVEQLVTPGDDDVQSLVALCESHDDVEGAFSSIGL